MGWLAVTLSYLEFMTSRRYTNSSSLKLTYTIFLPPSSVRIDEFEHRRSLGCRPCIAAVSHKSFCLGNPQRQSPRAEASVARPCLWTVLIEEMETKFVLWESCLLQQLVDFFVGKTGWNQLVPLKSFVSEEFLHFCLPSWTLVVWYPSSWSHFCSKKIVQFSLDTCQSAHSRFKTVCLMLL